MKTMILIFSVPKSKNYNEEEKNSKTAKAYLKKAILWMKFDQKMLLTLGSSSLQLINRDWNCLAIAHCMAAC